MGESNGSQGDLEQALKPFYQRASEAEDRLSRLEASLAKGKGPAVTPPDIGNQELLKKISQLELELQRTKTELVSEREKALKFEAENAKNHYRITHLVRALKDTSI